MRSFYEFDIFFETNIEVFSNATEIYNISFNKKSLEHTGIVCIFLFEFVVPEVQYTSERKAEKHGDLP